jgi:hypothetical protein
MPLFGKNREEDQHSPQHLQLPGMELEPSIQEVGSVPAIHTIPTVADYNDAAFKQATEQQRAMQLLDSVIRKTDDDKVGQQAAELKYQLVQAGALHRVQPPRLTHLDG